jgi:hypothetical protein
MEASLPAAPPDALAAWHDFYVLIGTASATLLGAMFVVVSIGSGFLTGERVAATRFFLTPTVLHLTTVLLGCALTTVPALKADPLALLIGLVGVLGLAYSLLVGRGVGRHHVDLGDRLWYGALPILGYAMMIAAAAMIFYGHPASLDALALALGMLLIAGLRNAWDMILFIVAQPKA